MNTLTYIWHDCFLLQTKEANIVFDFWKDPCVGDGESPLFLSVINKDLPLYVIVSHHHKDHYNKEIFSWGKTIPDIRFILSKDVAKFARHILRGDSIYQGEKPAPEEVCVLNHGETFDDGIVRIEAFGSTDIGNSYAVEVSGLRIFHAGDLNAWVWMDESTDKEIREAISSFTQILSAIKSRHQNFDVVMFPVDSRIGSGYFTGAKIFLQEIYAERFFPMHFELGETSAERMKYHLDAARIGEYANPGRGEYIVFQSPYSVYAWASRED